MTKKYHHGDLAQTLVSEFLQCIHTTPVDKISLRELAKRTGVAPGAAYNHFKNKNALLVSAKIRCMEHYSQHLAVVETTPSEPEQGIYQLGKASAEYARTYPHYYDFIWATSIDEKDHTDELIEISLSTGHHLHALITQLLKKHAIDNSHYNTSIGFIACWSMLQGLTATMKMLMQFNEKSLSVWPEVLQLDSIEKIDTLGETMSMIVINGLLETLKN